MSPETRLDFSRLFKSGLSVKFPKRGSNVDSLLKWLEYVDSLEFDRAVQASLTTKQRLSVLESVARAVIESEIYDAYEDPGTRTDNLRKSFIAVAGTPENSDMGVSVVSDISVAPAKSGKAKGKISYGTFFEDPVGLNSFIKPDEGDPLGPKRYRPFMDILTQEVFAAAENIAIEAASIAVKKRLPRGAK